MTGVRVRISIAVVPMLAPDSVASSVPEPIARSDSRPGMAPIHVSSVLIIFMAMPVRKSTSPIRMNSVIGNSTKTERLP